MAIGSWHVGHGQIFPQVIDANVNFRLVKQGLFHVP